MIMERREGGGFGMRGLHREGEGREVREGIRGGTKTIKGHLRGHIEVTTIESPQNL